MSSTLASAIVAMSRSLELTIVVKATENALIQACVEGHLEVVKLLVARGANVNARVSAPQGSAPQEGG